LAGRAVAKNRHSLLGSLEVAHAAGVLHRDVKPANVLICADGRCVLTDFGVARMPSEKHLTQPGMVLGSPHFISPSGRSVPRSGRRRICSRWASRFTRRPRADRRSNRGDPFETMRAIVEDQPAPATRAGVLTPVLMGLLEKDPEKRWTVTEARKALRDLTNGALTNPRGHTADRSAGGHADLDQRPRPPSTSRRRRTRCQVRPSSRTHRDLAAGRCSLPASR